MKKPYHLSYPLPIKVSTLSFFMVLQSLREASFKRATLDPIAGIDNVLKRKKMSYFKKKISKFKFIPPTF